MSKRNLIQKLTLGLLTGLSLAACSKAPLMMPPGAMQPYGRAPLQNMQTGLQAQAAAQIQVSFVKAYGRTAVENEAVSRRDPNSPGAILIRQIDAAKESLDGSFYDIDNADVVNAFLRARQRGVKIRLVTDSDNMTVKNSGPSGPPRPAITALQKAGIPVIDDKRSGIMHNKFLVIDGRKVWCGSTNLTDTSLYQHNNNALLLPSAKLAGLYTAEFERLFTQKVFGPNPPRPAQDPRVTIGQTQLEVYFSPRGGGQQAVIRELQNAKKRIIFMTFSLTDKTAGEIINQKAAAGLQVDGVFDSWLGASQYSLYSPMRNDGIGVSKDGNEALLHHKVIIVDDAVITGSYNYSANAENSNNENFLIIRNNPALTQAYLDEFARIKQVSHPGKPRPDVR